jgi:hypothetical protein
MELIDAQVTYALPEGNTPELSSSVFLKIEASSDAARLRDAEVVDVEHGVTTMRVADGIVKTIALARNGDLVTARKTLDATIRLAKQGQAKFADEAFAAKITELESIRKRLASFAPPQAAMNEPPAPSKAGMAQKPAAVMPSPREAMEMRAAHGDAMKELQGE